MHFLLQFTQIWSLPTLRCNLQYKDFSLRAPVLIADNTVCRETLGLNWEVQICNEQPACVWVFIITLISL